MTVDPYFEREYQCRFPQPSPKESRLLELAAEYVRRTEEYDRTVCTGPIVHGCIQPADSWQLTEINKNARAVRDELLKEVLELGFGYRDFNHEISHVKYRR